MSTKKPDLNKEAWGEKWEKDPPIKTKWDRPEWNKSLSSKGKSDAMENESPTKPSTATTAKSVVADTVKISTTTRASATAQEKDSKTKGESNVASSILGSRTLTNNASSSDKPSIFASTPSSFGKPKTQFSGSASTVGSQLGSSNGGFPPDGLPPGGNGNGHDDDKNNRKKRILVIIAIVVVMIGFAIGFSAIVRSCSSDNEISLVSVQERENILTLIQRYIERGEYDRAMDLLDQLLIKDANDEEALTMSDEVFALKAGAKLEDFERYQKGNATVDTSGLEEAVDRMATENAKNAEALTELAKNQEAQAEAEERNREEDRETERRRKEQAVAVETERKAREDILAQQNAELKERIEEVTDKVASGKAQLLSGLYTESLSHFDAVSKILPQDQKDFSGDKLSEIAALLQSSAQDELDPAKKTLLEDQAVIYAEKALEYTPDDPNSHYILGKQAAATKNYAAAADALTLAIQGDPNNPLYYEEFGTVQFLTEDYSKARSSFETAAKLDPGFYQAWFNAHLAYIKLGRTDDAISVLRKAVAVNDQYKKGWLALARLQNDKTDADGAIASYQKVLQLDSTDVDVLREIGSVYGSQNNFVEAEKYFRRALSYASNDPSNDARTNYNLSTALHAQKQFDDAATYALAAVTSDANNAVYQYNYGLISDELGDFDAAVAAYAQTLNIEPSHVKANINLGKLYLDMGDPDGALGFLTNAVSADETSFEAVNNLASAYLAKKDYPNAITHFLMALKLETSSETARMNLASSYASSEQYDNAKTIYIEVLQRNQDNLEAYLEIAKVCIALQDNVSAEKYLITIQAKDPNYRSDEVIGLLTTVE